MQEKFNSFILVSFMASWFPNKEARNAGKIQIPLFLFLSWLHGFLIRKPGTQEQEKS
jgi:hypothetical protein